MEAHDLEKELRYWGRVYGPAPETEWDEDSSNGSGLLTGCLIDFIRVGVVTGTEQERIVIDRSHDAPEQILVGSLTARGKESQGGAKPMKAHPIADRIDRLCCAMYRERVVPALVLRADYCMRGPRREKMPWVNAIVGRRISRRRYSTELEWAKSWMLLARRHSLTPAGMSSATKTFNEVENRFLYGDPSSTFRPVGIIKATVNKK